MANHVHLLLTVHIASMLAVHIASVQCLLFTLPQCLLFTLPLLLLFTLPPCSLFTLPQCSLFTLSHRLCRCLCVFQVKKFKAYRVNSFSYDTISKLSVVPEFNASHTVFPMPDDTDHYKLHRYCCPQRVQLQCLPLCVSHAR